MSAPTIIFDHEDFIRPASIEMHARLWWCALHGSVDQLMDLYPWFTNRTHLVNREGRSACHNMARHPEMFATNDMLRLCCAAGTNINAPDNKGITPLHMACMLGNMDGVRLLSAAGARWDAVDDMGLSPLGAMLSNCTPLIAKTSLHRFQENVKCCIDQGADPNQVCQDKNGNVTNPMFGLTHWKNALPLVLSNKPHPPEHSAIIEWFEELCLAHQRSVLNTAIDGAPSQCRPKSKI